MSKDLEAAAVCLLIFLDVAVGAYASHRMKRSFLTWFFLSLLVSPIVSFVFLLIIGPQPSPKEKEPDRASPP
jgi:hypothetical protein